MDIGWLESDGVCLRVHATKRRAEFFTDLLHPLVNLVRVTKKKARSDWECALNCAYARSYKPR